MGKSSLQEDERYLQLAYREKAGEIRNLKRQILFKFVHNGIEVFEYTADFAYIEGEEKVIEEFKGFEYARHDYRLRMRCCSAEWPGMIFRITTTKGMDTQYRAGRVLSKAPRKLKKLGRPKL